jgi:protein TonB
MEHAEGTVMLRVLVDVDGGPLEVTIEVSSGNRELDRAARAQVLKSWKFQPAMQDGRAVQAYGRVPVNFSLR